jgi:hypothetical protein
MGNPYESGYVLRQYQGMVQNLRFRELCGLANEWSQVCFDYSNGHFHGCIGVPNDAIDEALDDKGDPEFLTLTREDIWGCVRVDTCDGHDQIPVDSGS